LQPPPTAERWLFFDPPSAAVRDEDVRIVDYDSGDSNQKKRKKCQSHSPAKKQRLCESPPPAVWDKDDRLVVYHIEDIGQGMFIVPLPSYP